MGEISVHIDAAMVAGIVSLNIGLTIALAAALLANRKARHEPEFAAEGLAREILMGRKSPYRAFSDLKFHLGGFSDDELRKILVRAGGIRFSAGGLEVWGLLSRNRQYLAGGEIKGEPAAQIAFDSGGQPQVQLAGDAAQQDQGDAAREAPGAFERVRAEMLKLGTLECVRPVIRQE